MRKADAEGAVFREAERAREQEERKLTTIRHCLNMWHNRMLAIA